MKPLSLIAVWLVLAAHAFPTFAQHYTPGEIVEGSFVQFARPLVHQFCLDCHSDDTLEGNLSFEKLTAVDSVNAEVWKRIWTQVTLKEMPPSHSDQLETVERLKLADWIAQQLNHATAAQGGFTEPSDPQKGNYVDHDLLFGPLPKNIRLVPTSSPARIWRVTPQEHITRLNELINREPEFNPVKPGLRTHGDEVPTNHGGELKLYFGTDRIIKWQGGTVAYATAVKSLPAILSTAREHGLENYPELYSVNSAEAVQILGAAEDILRYMAYGPLSIAEPYQITDDPASIADKMKGDIRGLPTSLVYSTEVKRPLTPVYELMDSDKLDPDQLQRAVDFLFEALTFRPPTPEESREYLRMVEDSIAKLGKEQGAILGLSAIFLDRDALFRPELGQNGRPDEYGRVMLQDWELGLAVNHAFSYIPPDETLKTAITEGRMRTRDDVRREVQRMLEDPSVRKPRVIRFFREFFDYDEAGYVCKDNRALGQTGVSGNGNAHYRSMFDATASTDRLIELILSEDREVLKRLLTTQQAVTTPSDRLYFGRQRSRDEVAASVAQEKRAAQEAVAREKAELEAWKQANPGKEPPKTPKRKRPNINHQVTEAELSGPRVFARVSRRSFGNGSMRPDRNLSDLPTHERLGLLTHPSWLVSHSDAMDNHAIRRGRWVRERLLGGGIPDVPITVDAMLPDAPQKTLRERMEVTRQTYCWTCHEKMDPLGLPFEIYNHAGLYRNTELGKPVDASGEIIDSGDPELDGPVQNALEMIEKLAESQRVEEVFVRHAFRFWMGRNETLNDGPVLQEAHRAYRESGGSMNALLVSLLTSDAFLYRHQTPN
jgi:hypothetical protein